MAVAGALEFDQFVPRHQAVAVDAHEAAVEFLFQRLQRFLDQILAAGVVDHHVLLLGLEVMHFLDRNQPQAAAHPRAQMGTDLARRTGILRAAAVGAAGDEHARALQRRRQAFGPDRLHQVIDCRGLEGG